LFAGQCQPGAIVIPPNLDSNPEVQPSRVTLKTVFTISFGVLIVAGLVMAIIHSLVAIALTYAAVLLAVTLDHGVQMLIRRGLKRSIAIAVVSVSLAGLLVGIGFTLIPPAVSQGRTLIEQAPAFIRNARVVVSSTVSTLVSTWPITS
jgi:predicted PurR-regulated permease PerM